MNLCVGPGTPVELCICFVLHFLHFSFCFVVSSTMGLTFGAGVCFQPQSASFGVGDHDATILPPNNNDAKTGPGLSPISEETSPRARKIVSASPIPCFSPTHIPLIPPPSSRNRGSGRTFYLLRSLLWAKLPEAGEPYARVCVSVQ